MLKFNETPSGDCTECQVLDAISLTQIEWWFGSSCFCFPLGFTLLTPLIFTDAIKLSVILFSTSQSEILLRCMSVSCVSKRGFFSCAISEITLNSSSYFFCIACKKTSEGSHSVSLVMISKKHLALSSLVVTCLSEYMVVPLVWNGMNASLCLIPQRSGWIKRIVRDWGSCYPDLVLG